MCASVVRSEPAPEERRSSDRIVQWRAVGASSTVFADGANPARDPAHRRYRAALRTSVGSWSGGRSRWLSRTGSKPARRRSLWAFVRYFLGRDACLPARSPSRKSVLMTRLSGSPSRRRSSIAAAMSSSIVRVVRITTSYRFRILMSMMLTVSARVLARVGAWQPAIGGPSFAGLGPGPEAAQPSAAASTRGGSSAAPRTRGVSTPAGPEPRASPADGRDLPRWG